MFLRAPPAIGPEKVTVIPMGFDSEAFTGLVPNHRPRFTITHFGSFYGPRSPGPFLIALGECVQEHPNLSKEIAVLFFGLFEPRLRKLAEELVRRHHLDGIVRFEGTIPYETGLQHLVSSHVLLLVTAPGWTGQKLIPTKLFEYLAAGRPILALTPDGAAAQVMRAANGGMIVEPDNIPAIRTAILELYQTWREGRLISLADRDVVAGFAWRELTGNFVATLEDALALCPANARSVR
jgi:glycosyltransferase involved in cell wall biosynthesis